MLSSSDALSLPAVLFNIHRLRSGLHQVEVLVLVLLKRRVP